MTINPCPIAPEGETYCRDAACEACHDLPEFEIDWGQTLISTVRNIRVQGGVPITGLVTLEQIAHFMENDPALKRHTESTRALYRPGETSGGAEYKARKLAGLAIIPSLALPVGTMVDGQHEPHTRLYFFDLDEDLSDTAAAVAALADYPHTVEVRESMRPDGHGLWCLIAGPTATSWDDHKAVWPAIERQIRPGTGS